MWGGCSVLETMMVVQSGTCGIWLVCVNASMAVGEIVGILLGLVVLGFMVFVITVVVSALSIAQKRATRGTKECSIDKDCKAGEYCTHTGRCRRKTSEG